jgi:hypothetical protein
MNAQRSDLIASRDSIEREGETFYCFECGGSLGSVRDGFVSDMCEACEEEFARSESLETHDIAT